MTAAVQARRPLWVDAVLLGLAAALFLSLLALGAWQLRRADWKRDLIEAVESRAHGEPVAVPAGEIAGDRHAYLRVRVEGTLRHVLTRKVKAVTEIGAGYWLLTPLWTGETHVWINRGFVPAGTAPEDWTAPAGRLAIAGLLRVAEPGGTVLEKNDPESGRWVSRDIAALSGAAGIEAATSYFVDADHGGGPATWPRGGLTLLKFRNAHLSYAITWFAMAGLFLAGMVYVVQGRVRGRH